MILEQIAEDTKLRVAKAKSRIPLSQVKEMALQKNRNTGFPFEKAIRQKEIQFICEVKKASPSKGIIAQEFPYLSIAKEYEQAGAAAISVLTEPDYFKGSDQYLKEIAEEVKIPVLRKDFVVDEYMIYEAKVLGASAVLLICALLDTGTIRDYIKICDELGLSALVEAHDEKEIESAIFAGARIIGVNNRNLKDFTVDIKNSVRLRRLAPEDTIFVAESGIQTAEDIAVLKQAGVDAVLIGETMMRSSEKAALIQKLRGRTKVKICGLKSLEDIKMVNRHLPDYAGFVFADSKRKVTLEQAREMKAELDERILAVGVFVNEEPEKIISLCNQQIIDIVQLHGDENKEYVDKLKKQITNPIIKAIRIAPPDRKEEEAEDRRNSLEFDEESADFLLFDTWEKGTYGGTGKEIANQPMPVIGRPCFLAGGLNSSNVLEKINKLHPYAVDVSSGVEMDGRKDEQKVREFLETVRK